MELEFKYTLGMSYTRYTLYQAITSENQRIEMITYSFVITCMQGWKLNIERYTFFSNFCHLFVMLLLIRALQSCRYLATTVHLGVQRRTSSPIWSRGYCRKSCWKFHIVYLHSLKWYFYVCGVSACLCLCVGVCVLKKWGFKIKSIISMLSHDNF